MNYYSIDEATKLLMQFDITHSKQMVNRWVRDSIIIAEIIDQKYMISEDILLSFIEQRKPKMIQLIECTNEISRGMKQVIDKLTSIDEKILELSNHNSLIEQTINELQCGSYNRANKDEELLEIKQLLKTINTNLTIQNQMKKSGSNKNNKTDEENQLLFLLPENDSEINDEEGNTQESNKEDPVNELQIDNELQTENDSVINDEEKNTLENNKEDPVDESKEENELLVEKEKQIENTLPFSEEQIKQAMCTVIDDRTYNQYGNEILCQIQKVLLERKKEWYNPIEKTYKSLNKKATYKSDIPFLKNIASYVSEDWNVKQQ